LQGDEAETANAAKKRGHNKRKRRQQQQQRQAALKAGGGGGVVVSDGRGSGSSGGGGGFGGGGGGPELTESLASKLMFKYFQLWSKEFDRKSPESDFYDAGNARGKDAAGEL
jgi:hypothetical protein